MLFFCPIKKKSFDYLRSFIHSQYDNRHSSFLRSFFLHHKHTHPQNVQHFFVPASNDSASRGCPVLLMIARKTVPPINQWNPQPNRIYNLSKVMAFPCPHRFFSLHVSLSPIFILHATANNPQFWVHYRPTHFSFNLTICSRCRPCAAAEYLFVSINLCFPASNA